jgi:hypothetical protein
MLASAVEHMGQSGGEVETPMCERETDLKRQGMQSVEKQKGSVGRIQKNVKCREREREKR